MLRFAIRWIVAVAALIVGAYVIVVGVNLLPGRTVAQARDTAAQLTLTWVLIGATALAALVLAAFLIRASASGDEPSHTARH